jgi:putative FmdB family regulatory protein
MPNYAYQCEQKGCDNLFEDIKPMSESSKPVPCPKCGKQAERTVICRTKGPTFTEKLYGLGGFYHEGIGEVVTSEKDLRNKCKALGFETKHEGAQMNAKQERRMMHMRRRVKSMA